LSTEETLHGLNKLIEVKRFISAINAVLYSLEKVPSKTIVDLLQQMATDNSNEKIQIQGYEIGRLFEELDNRQDVNYDSLLQLEWYYLSILTSYGAHRKPKLLYKQLSQDPNFFVDLLKWIYIPKDKELLEKEREGITDEILRQRAERSYFLLNDWKTIPGVNENGILNLDFLKTWIQKVRESAALVSRLDFADMNIGKILAQYPETDTNWPTEEIFEIIEEINTEGIKSSFSSALFNKRGSSSRGPFDGGNIERSHAKYFADLSQKVKNKFPNVSVIFEELSKGYEADAKRMDDRAERDRLDFA
jgi:hypothetical protein